MSEQVKENGNLGFHLFHIPYLSFHKSADLAATLSYSLLYEGRPVNTLMNDFGYLPETSTY